MNINDTISNQLNNLQTILDEAHQICDDQLHSHNKNEFYTPIKQKLNQTKNTLKVLQGITQSLPLNLQVIKIEDWLYPLSIKNDGLLARLAGKSFQLETYVENQNLYATGDPEILEECMCIIIQTIRDHIQKGKILINTFHKNTTETKISITLAEDQFIPAVQFDNTDIHYIQGVINLMAGTFIMKNNLIEITLPRHP